MAVLAGARGADRAGRRPRHRGGRGRPPHRRGLPGAGRLEPGARRPGQRGHRVGFQRRRVVLPTSRSRTIAPAPAGHRVGAGRRVHRAPAGVRDARRSAERRYPRDVVAPEAAGRPPACAPAARTRWTSRSPSRRRRRSCGWGMPCRWCCSARRASQSAWCSVSSGSRRRRGSSRRSTGRALTSSGRLRRSSGPTGRGCSTSPGVAVRLRHGCRRTFRRSSGRSAGWPAGSSSATIRSGRRRPTPNTRSTCRRWRCGCSPGCSRCSGCSSSGSCTRG